MLNVLRVEDFWMFLKRNLKLKRRVLPSREQTQSPDHAILIAEFNHFAVKTYSLSYWFFQDIFWRHRIGSRPVAGTYVNRNLNSQLWNHFSIFVSR